MLSPDAIVMGEVAKVVMSPSGSIGDFANIIIQKLPSIICMVVIKKCVENAADFFYAVIAGVKSTFRTLFYTDMLIHTEDPMFYHRKKSYGKRELVLANGIFPIYYVKPAEGLPAMVSFMNWFPKHNSIIDEIEADAEKDKKEYDELKSSKKTLYKKLTPSLKYENSKASKLYPSSNYVNLVSIIRAHIDVSRLTESYSVLGMLIDGVPGLGKTKFADFASEERIFTNIYKVDMTTMLKHPFDTVLNSVYHGVEINHDTLFMIDEIDKYIDYRIRAQYDELRKKNNKKKEGDVIDDLSFEDYTSTTKNTFLYDMLSILERDGLAHPVVVIFCSNNFHSVFEGVDMTHHRSLYNRFMKIKFGECNHEEIINYIIHYNNKFEGSNYYKELDKDQISNMLRKDVKITHRSLHHISIKCKYNAELMVKSINEHVSEDDSGESISNIRNKKSVSSNEVSRDVVITNESTSTLTRNIQNNVSRLFSELETKKTNESVTDESDTSESEDSAEEEDSEEKMSLSSVEEEKDLRKSESEEEAIDILKRKLIEKIRSKKGISDAELIELIDDNPEVKDNPEVFDEVVRENKMFLENRKEHENAWREKFSYEGELPSALKQNFVYQIKLKLEACENEKSTNKRCAVCIELFDYLAEDAYIMFDSHDKFKETVKDKFFELRDSCKGTTFLAGLKPRTCEFIYALTGERV